MVLHYSQKGAVSPADLLAHIRQLTHARLPRESRPSAA